ncbi:hypothetical protein E4188_23740 (plasmid) [Aeromonas media]|uniref:DUF2570 domain-containing protein n=2 Tax=Aeromonas TaxID=642 RepID=A0ABX6NYQ0_AERME|nr:MULTISPECIES: hypothetical protein [Aeromonas]ASI21469.1 hypothetical protein CE456_01070 [Aeromonas salmonicida]QJT41504.1 hypothetical protein E4188_23740 [Aeromonas media]QLI59096.1 hypothetical protein C0708_23395 [Aeromonas caviae]QLI60323.1 hypothetical protein C1C91_23040 [Aeromonas caviae]HDN9373708.1 hypothetical protein [Aeromonas salmonicida]
METIIVLGFLAILVFAFAGGMREQLLKSTEADQRELDGHRKKAMMEEAATMAANIIKQEFSHELSEVRFKAAVETAVEERLRAAGGVGETANPAAAAARPARPAQAEASWRAQAAGMNLHPQSSNENGDEQLAYQPAEYSREQDFPQPRPM